MVSIQPPTPRTAGAVSSSWFSFRKYIMFLLTGIGVTGVFFVFAYGDVFLANQDMFHPPSHRLGEYEHAASSASSLRRSNQHQSAQLDDNSNDRDHCRWYLAQSAIPKGGLGLFTAFGLHPGDEVGFPDICIFVGDAPDEWTHLRSHSWGIGTFFGQYEGSNSRAACEGFTTILNTMPQNMINTDIVSPILPTNAGLHRASSPGAGGITHHFGVHAKARDIIRAGSELTINYGDWDFDQGPYTKPERPVKWLQENGWCVDNLRVGPSKIPHAGRGAFARRSLRAGEVVAPAPLQIFANRSLFQKTKPEQLFVNYCLQPTKSEMIFYPYGPVFNLINHDGEMPNVFLRWSNNSMHQRNWLDLSLEALWNVTYPGGLVLEAVALRDIRAGEEIVMDYGVEWDEAWKRHVESWQPAADSDRYVYPAEIDETETLRTVKEQKKDPYPSNLMTMCSTPDWDPTRTERRQIDWYEPTQWPWYSAMTPCFILSRKKESNGEYFYNVQLAFSTAPGSLVYNETMPKNLRYIDKKVPRRAIRFVEKPNIDDEHLPRAFRHPIVLPEHLLPSQWNVRQSEIGSK